MDPNDWAQQDMEDTTVMQMLERLLFWLGHLSIIGAVAALYYRDELSNPSLGYQVFASGVLSYTMALALSIYLDKTQTDRKANHSDTQTLGSVLKPALLMCLVSVLVISAGVILIAELASTA